VPRWDDCRLPVLNGHLILIGMMGAGKTSVGARCAQLLERPFVDVDELVEATTGRSVAEIFGTDGEAAFRALESAALRDACASPAPMVIAVGGGAMEDADNRRLLTNSTVVWLRAEPEELARRVTADGTMTRPKLAGRGEPVEVLGRLLALRSGVYESLADATVSTDGRDIDTVADLVVEEVARCDA
jgi:shikimate kinase